MFTEAWREIRPRLHIGVDVVVDTPCGVAEGLQHFIEGFFCGVDDVPLPCIIGRLAERSAF